MPSRFSAVTNKEISQLIKQAVPKIHEEGEEEEEEEGEGEGEGEGDEVRFGSFNR